MENYPTNKDLTMTTPSPIARTIKCLLAALLAHACTVNAFDNPAEGFLNDFTGFSTSSAAAPASSSGSWFSLLTSLPSISSLFSGARSSSSTQSSSTGQSSLSPSLTQLATGAAIGASALAYAYLYKSLSKNYSRVNGIYADILQFVDDHKDKTTTAKSFTHSLSTQNKSSFLEKVKAVNEKYDTDNELVNFKVNLQDDIDSLGSLGSWTSFGWALYDNVKKLTARLLFLQEVVQFLISPPLQEREKLIDQTKTGQGMPATPTKPTVNEQSAEEKKLLQQREEAINESIQHLTMLSDINATSEKYKKKLQQDIQPHIQNLISYLDAASIDKTAQIFSKFAEQHPGRFLELISQLENQAVREQMININPKAIFGYIDQMLPNKEEFLKIIQYFPDIFLNYIKNNPAQFAAKIKPYDYFSDLKQRSLPQDWLEAITTEWNGAVSKQPAAHKQPTAAKQTIP
ncbi:MAG: hypothetical protein IT346_00975 [Epsilonproteobacteria bacterium]|nr:hypothetical protein [Campylobacterota bacterium]